MSAHLAIVSHKPCWRDSASPSGYATVGGFPFQIDALSQLFEGTRLLVPVLAGLPPEGALALRGFNLQVVPLEGVAGSGRMHQLRMLPWIPRNLGKLRKVFKQVDVIHALVPGDVGLIGILAALSCDRPLFVRHCGTWGQPRTATERVLHRLLLHLARGRGLVFATGGGAAPPQPQRPLLRWIFSTSLPARTLRALPPPSAWRPEASLRLVHLGRMTREKNAESVLRALPRIRQHHPQAELHLVGEGPELPRLKALAQALGLQAGLRFHGRLPHPKVLELLSQATLLVFPTRLREGFPKAVTEALACGLGVIASPVSVLPYLLADQGCGWLLEEDGPEGVTRKVLEVLSDPEALHTRRLRGQQFSQTLSLEGWQAALRQGLLETWPQLGLRPEARGTEE